MTHVNIFYNIFNVIVRKVIVKIAFLNSEHTPTHDVLNNIY